MNTDKTDLEGHLLDEDKQDNTLLARIRNSRGRVKSYIAVLWRQVGLQGRR